MRSVLSALFLLALAGPQLCAALVTRGPWVGAVTENSAVLVARLEVRADGAWLEVSESPDFRGARRIEPATPPSEETPPELVRFTLTDLRPQTLQYYRVRHPSDAGRPDEATAAGSFRTFPRAGETASFRFAFGSCASTGSAHPVFEQIRAQQPAFFLTIGDLHYENIAENRRERFHAAYDAVLGSPTQRALYRAVPVVYTWDDHDFGPNDSNRHSPSRLASLAAYRDYVPHHPLPWDAEQATTPDQRKDGPIAQAFTLGRARFLVLDTRSERDAVRVPDSAAKTMLGAWQKAWLQRELLAAKDKLPLIFIVSSVSWVSDETDKRDNWGRFATERAELSDWMVAHGITGVCFVSGDAHMLAADDGRHNAYARHGGPHFPALQAAPLDRGGSIKGGPWSVAPVLPDQGEGQFGLVDVTDRGDRLDVLFRGLNQDGREKLRLEFSVPAAAGARSDHALDAHPGAVGHQK